MSVGTLCAAALQWSDNAAANLLLRLIDGSRKQLLDWMIGSEITASLLHAGLPEGWRIADKSGSGDNNTRNDIGLILRPEGEPIPVAVTQSPEPLPSREKVIAEIGRFVSQVFGA
jgi:beta-lactamase class A